MKKIIIIATIMLSGIMADAQTLTQPLLAYTAAYVRKSTPDTLVNTDSSYLATGAIQAFYDMYFVVTNTKVSGTVGGTIVCQGSMTGGTSNTEWNTIANNKAEAPFITDTFTATNGTLRFEYHIPNHQFTYYRVRYINSGGTQSSVMTGTAYLRKHSFSQY